MVSGVNGEPRATGGSSPGAGNNECGEAVKERSFSVCLGEMGPPLIGFRLSENTAGYCPGNVPAQQKLKKIVGNSDGTVGNGDICHSNLAEEAGKTPANPTVLHSVAKGKRDLRDVARAQSGGPDGGP